MLHKFDQVLARSGLTAGEMDLQHADFSELGEHLLPFRRRQLTAAAFQLDRIRAIGTLQRTAMCYFRKHRERNTESLSRRAALLQPREPVRAGAGHCACIGKRRTHEVLSRASVKNSLSARSCSMAMTSVAIRAGRLSLTRWTLFPRRSASLDPIFDFFNAGINSGLPRLELRFTDDLRKSGPRIDYPVPTRRGAFLYVKFYLAMSQESSCSFPAKSTPNAGASFTNYIPPVPFL